MVRGGPPGRAPNGPRPAAGPVLVVVPRDGAGPRPPMPGGGGIGLPLCERGGPGGGGIGLPLAERGGTPGGADAAAASGARFVASGAMLADAAAASGARFVAAGAVLAAAGTIGVAGAAGAVGAGVGAVGAT